MVINCKICGRSFYATRPNQKYCCEACRIAGQKQTRAAWNARTNWREKDAARHRAKTAKQREDARIIAETRELSDREQGNKRQRQKQTDLKTKAAAGDPAATMIIELQRGGKQNPEYWKAYAKYFIDTADRSGKPCAETVNGISVLEQDFAAQVIESIQDGGRIITSTKS